MMVALSALLAIALVWIQRRHSGFGAYLVAGVLVLAAAVSYQIREAWALPSYDFNLTTPSGVASKYCPQPSQPVSTQGDGSNYLTVYNGTSNPLGLVITPLNGASLTWGAPKKCETTLGIGVTCNLPCRQE